MRSLTNVRFVLLEEADFFPPGEQEDARHISERYIAKSDCNILMISTPNAPMGLFETIENERDSLYNKIFLHWQVGYLTIYSKEEIATQMRSVSFAREYELRYLGGVGNLIPQQDINSAIEEYDLDENVITSSHFTRWIGIDPGYSSSQFGMCVLQWKDDKCEVVYTNSLTKPLYTDTLHLVRQLIQQFHVCKVFIDASASHLIHELKHGYNEYIPYEKLRPDVLKRQISSGCGDPLIVPINFQKLHKSMAKHLVKVLAHKRVRIHPSFDNLIVSLKSATTKDEISLGTKIPGPWLVQMDPPRGGTGGTYEDIQISRTEQRLSLVSCNQL